MTTEMPILILCFRRPRQLQNLLDRVLPLGRKIYIAQDVPRGDSPHYFEGFSQTKSVIREAMELSPLVHIADRPDEPLGLKRSWESAISYVAQRHEAFVVLEDDVLPSPGFFRFIETELALRSDDKRVGHIAGFNYVPRRILAQPEHASRLSVIPHTLGMALTRSWVEMFRSDLTDWRDWLSPTDVRDLVRSRAVARNWCRAFDRVARGQADSWAIPWSASLWAMGRLAVTANQNQVQYDGYESGTHSNPTWKQLPFEDSREPVSPTPAMDVGADRWEFAHGFRYDTKGTALRYTQIALSRILSSHRR